VPGVFEVGRSLGALWTGGVPGPARSGAVAVDATADPGAWLLRILLATNAERLVVAVGNDHPDLADALSQRALADLVAPKWRLKFRRSTPGRHSALVEAVASDERAGDLRRHVLDRAHGRLVNVWRDGLVTHRGLTRAAATEAAVGVAPDVTLMELPRHRLARLLEEVEKSGE
jgi:hypothetical protein